MTLVQPNKTSPATNDYFFSSQRLHLFFLPWFVFCYNKNHSSVKYFVPVQSVFSKKELLTEFWLSCSMKWTMILFFSTECPNQFEAEGGNLRLNFPIGMRWWWLKRKLRILSVQDGFVMSWKHGTLNAARCWAFFYFGEVTSGLLNGPAHFLSLDKL